MSCSFDMDKRNAYENVVSPSDFSEQDNRGESSTQERPSVENPYEHLDVDQGITGRSCNYDVLSAPEIREQSSADPDVYNYIEDQPTVQPKGKQRIEETSREAVKSLNVFENAEASGVEQVSIELGPGRQEENKSRAHRLNLFRRVQLGCGLAQIIGGILAAGIEIAALSTINRVGPGTSQNLPSMHYLVPGIYIGMIMVIAGILGMVSSGPLIKKWHVKGCMVMSILSSLSALVYLILSAVFLSLDATLRILSYTSQNHATILQTGSGLQNIDALIAIDGTGMAIGTIEFFVAAFLAANCSKLACPGTIERIYFMVTSAENLAKISLKLISKKQGSAAQGVQKLDQEHFGTVPPEEEQEGVINDAYLDPVTA